MKGWLMVSGVTVEITPPAKRHRARRLCIIGRCGGRRTRKDASSLGLCRHHAAAIPPSLRLMIARHSQAHDIPLAAYVDLLTGAIDTMVRRVEAARLN